MNPYYYNELPVTGMDEEALMFIGAAVLGIAAVVLLFALVFWIIRSVSLHKIARRRGIRHAWLAWVPIGGQWILGSLADQYQHLVQGKITSRRKIMLILAAAGAVLGVGSNVLTILQGLLAVTEEEALVYGLAGAVPAFLTWGISIATLVFHHICNYDLYRSCSPQNAVVFLVVGIVLPICEPFFYLACRKKDLGMIIPKPGVPTEPAELPRVDPEF